MRRIALVLALLSVVLAILAAVSVRDAARALGFGFGAFLLLFDAFCALWYAHGRIIPVEWASGYRRGYERGLLDAELGCPVCGGNWQECEGILADGSMGCTRGRD